MDYKELYKGIREASTMVDNGELNLLDEDISGDIDTSEASNGIMQVRRPKARPQPKPKKESYEEMILKYFKDVEKVNSMGKVRPKARPGTPVPPVEGSLSVAREAIAAVESRGSGDYKALGKVMDKGMYKGQRAIGRYQVMEGNIPSWTKKALGKSLTTEEFLANPKAQDTVVEHQLQQSYNKHGTWEDAASVWFTGKPADKAGNVSDGLTTAPEYIKKFQTAYVDIARKNLPEQEEVMSSLVRRRTK